MRFMIVVAACAPFAFAQPEPFELLCTMDSFAIIGADAKNMEVLKVAATRTPRDLAMQDTYVVGPGGVRERDSMLLWADWSCRALDSGGVLCASGGDETSAVEGYFEIDERGFFRAHNPTDTQLQIAVGVCEQVI